MSVVDQLVDMGFERERAERAFKETNSSIEQAMEWLLAHDGQELPPEVKAEVATAVEEAASSLQVRSFVCNDCQKILRDENALMFHASKSGHENFSESTEEIKPLTDEEKKQKAEELRVRIKAARAAKDELEKKEQLEKEIRRREEGKKVAEMKEQHRLNEMKLIAEARKKEKEETEQARLRVLEQVRQDKEERRARMAGEPVKEVTAPVHVVKPPPKTDYTQATIQIRLLDGSVVRNTFGAHEQLAAIRLWLTLNHAQNVPSFKLMTPFPRKVFSDDDFDTPLKDLGLVPSANLVMTV